MTLKLDHGHQEKERKKIEWVQLNKSDHQSCRKVWPKLMSIRQTAYMADLNISRESKGWKNTVYFSVCNTL